jgi:hypothetical protein
LAGSAKNDEESEKERVKKESLQQSEEDGIEVAEEEK